MILNGFNLVLTILSHSFLSEYPSNFVAIKINF
jgi:hypothetical protein